MEEMPLPEATIQEVQVSVPQESPTMPVSNMPRGSTSSTFAPKTAAMSTAKYGMVRM